jgi:hypothetical protein
MEELKQTDIKVSSLDSNASLSSCCRNLKISSHNASSSTMRERSMPLAARLLSDPSLPASATSVPLDWQRHYKHKIRLVQPTFIRVIGRRKLRRVFD